MQKSYGDAYSQRSSDEGYGERYGETVKVEDEKKYNTTELQRGATAERDQKEEAGMLTYASTIYLHCKINYVNVTLLGSYSCA